MGVRSGTGESLRDAEIRRLKLASGGQTGVDRAALDVGLALGLAVGGWCPQGRWAEDGAIPDRYPLTETPERDYEARTRRNIEDADGTLILNVGKLDGGTALAARHARQVGKPCLVVALEAGIEPAAFRGWLDNNRIRNSLPLRHDSSCPRRKAVRTLAIEKNGEHEGEI